MPCRVRPVNEISRDPMSRKPKPSKLLAARGGGRTCHTTAADLRLRHELARSCASSLVVSEAPEQLAWRNIIRDHIATSLGIESDDFDCNAA